MTKFSAAVADASGLHMAFLDASSLYLAKPDIARTLFKQDEGQLLCPQQSSYPDRDFMFNLVRRLDGEHMEAPGLLRNAGPKMGCLPNYVRLHSFDCFLD